MKRIIALILSFAMLFAFSACGKEEAPTDDVTPTSEPAYTLQSGDDIHTIVLVSDTQRYDEKTFNELFDDIVADKDTYNIEYVAHTGDIIQEGGDINAKWQVAKDAIGKLNGVIPYGVLAGNHDQDVNSSAPFEVFSKYFGDDTYKDCEYFAGSYADCQAHAQLVTIGSTDFVFVYLCSDPDVDCMKFAGDMFAKYSDRVGVLCTHKYLDEDFEISETGNLISGIVKANENVKLVLCGHESTAGYSELKLDDGRVVPQVIADYQDSNNKGTVMYLQIDEKAGTLTGISYSPITKSYDGYKDIDTDQFQIKLPW